MTTVITIVPLAVCQRSNARCRADDGHARATQRPIDMPARSRARRRRARRAPERRRRADTARTTARSVCPISMFCGLPISVAGRADVRGARQREQVGHRIEPPPRADLDQHRRHRQADDVVGEHRREPAGGDDHEREQPRRRVLARAEPSRQRGVEAAAAGTAPRSPSGRSSSAIVGTSIAAHAACRRHPARGDQRDRAEQREAGAIEPSRGISPTIMPT